VLEYLEDLKYYYKNGYAYPISYEMSCPLIKNMADTFRYVLDKSIIGFALDCVYHILVQQLHLCPTRYFLLLPL
jgi:hypothetical protein